MTGSKRCGPRPCGNVPRRALTLLELLVVIAILAVLMGLGMSGVQKVRAAAARAVCQNKLRQVGVALHLHHDAVGHFPTGISGERPDEPQPFLGWCARLLPYLEEAALWQRVEAAYRADRDFLKHDLLGVPVRHFACPSDRRVRTAQPVGSLELPRAFTSYLGVEGFHAFKADGVLYLDSKTKLADIADGASNTLMVGERPPSKDLIMGWWYAGWGQDKDGEGDMLLGVRTRNTSIYGPGCPPGPYDFKPGDFDDQCDAFHFWSPHPNGANFALADGSVRFIRYSANALMPALASRSGGEAEAVP